jgi:dTDP-4-amino-4,6-dideoxygalactose transaminase
MIIGVNSRLDELQAALNVKLPYLEIENDKRRSIARRYLSEIRNDKIILPLWIYRIIMFSFVCYSNKQQTGITRLFTEKRSKLQFIIHRPQTKALQQYHELSFPTEKMHDEVLSIPLNPILSGNKLILLSQL